MAQRRIKSPADRTQKGSPSNAAKKTAARPRPVRSRRPQPTAGLAASEEIRIRIEKLAYELYQRRGRQDGHDRQDWLEAERLTLLQAANTRPAGLDRHSGSSEP